MATDMKCPSRHIAAKAWILFAMLLMVLYVPQKADAAKHSDLFIRCALSEQSPYERQGTILTVNLYSVTPDIAFARQQSTPRLEKGKFFYLSNVEYPREMRRERIDGRDYYIYVLNAYLINMHEKGSYKIVGGEYNIGVNVPVVYDDPFWGRTRSVKTERFTVDVEPFKFKVKSLPEASASDDFSGAVGEFTVTTSIPPGDVVVNREATAVITVQGKGMIGKDLMPEYRSAFGDGVKLKSVSENCESYFDGRNVVSVLTLECEFIPTSRDATIGPVTFGFFNPRTGKYVKAESKPVKVDVKSGTSQMETQEV